MKDLKVTERMSSLQIAELTEKRHANVMRDIRSLLEQGLDELNFELVEYVDSKGESRPCYNLTKKGCLILASGYDAVLRAKIIDRWEELELEKQNGGFKTPTTFKEALLLAVKQQEELEEKERIIEEKKKLIAVQAPKAEFYDDIMGSKNTCEMRQVAKVLNMGVGRNNLFEILREEGILMQNNEPYQDYVDRGYFRMVESKWINSKGDVETYQKTVVYQKGISYIRKVLLKRGYVSKDKAL